MRTNSLCIMRLPICEFFCLLPVHMGTPRMQGPFLMCLRCISDLWLSHPLNQNFLGASAHPPTQKTSLVEYCLVHHNIFCVTRSPFAFRDIITPCLRSGISRYCSAHHILFGDIIAPWRLGISRISLSTPHSKNPRMHTGVKINPRMQTGITCHAIPVCIRGLHHAIPVCIRGSRTIPVCIQG